MIKTITGTTQNLGVMGWPIAHSLSPAMQNAAIAAASVDAVYTAFAVEPQALALAVAGLRTLHFRGWNVTIPHKQAIMDALDEIDEDAAAIGAVNTVVNDGGRLKGYNTDVVGFLGGLRDAGFDPAEKNVVLLGAGGAARAALWGLMKSHAMRVTVGARHPEKAEALIDDFAARASMLGTKLAAMHWETEAFRGAFSHADLVVNVTPLGMTPHTDDKPPVDWREAKPDAFAYDIIYTPEETRFLHEAAALGHRTLNGEDMLVQQGAAAFELWFGRKADASVMKQTLRAQLSGAELVHPVLA
ncbi:shikimate dehydrogenase [Selenomonas sp.]|uniref:shikimate dehydrogenase n=1 Tax=Selenomonas sp. TaxID=2053611 RepID=UPI0025D96947|nr:shikimate dehydrogenase [Selenomonas sp.]MCI6284713.1 shikimate dehydrogenase [Selenomonas sp.]